MTFIKPITRKFGFFSVFYPNIPVLPQVFQFLQKVIFADDFYETEILKNGDNSDTTHCYSYHKFVFSAGGSSVFDPRKKQVVPSKVRSPPHTPHVVTPAQSDRSVPVNPAPLKGKTPREDSLWVELPKSRTSLSERALHDAYGDSFQSQQAIENLKNLLRGQKTGVTIQGQGRNLFFSKI